LGKGIGVVALVVVSARLLVPWLLFHVAGTRSREVFLMGDRLVVSGSPKDAVNVVDLARGVEG
jgi:predicted Kef-type K+ transport protein